MVSAYYKGMENKLDFKMCLEKLWIDITNIYEEYDFKNKLIVNNIIILGFGGYYCIKSVGDSGITISISCLYDIKGYFKKRKTNFRDFKLEIDKSDDLDFQKRHSESELIDIVYLFLRDIMRDSKLNKIGI